MADQKRAADSLGELTEPAAGVERMEFDEVRDLLPQKEPFVFVDRVLELVRGERIVCLKNVSGNEFWIRGHFPGNALMPGVLILEALAQSALILVLKTHPEMNNKLGVLGSVKARFLRPVVPGDRLIMRVRIEKLISKGGIVDAEATVNDQKAVTAKLVFGIVDRGSLDNSRSPGGMEE
jgi:3-hydroxyacyl-[acyl-carrier-protein] dehydratase